MTTTVCMHSDLTRTKYKRMRTNEKDILYCCLHLRLSEFFAERSVSGMSQLFMVRPDPRYYSIRICPLSNRKFHITKFLWPRFESDTGLFAIFKISKANRKSLGSRAFIGLDFQEHLLSVLGTREISCYQKSWCLTSD